MTQTGHIWQIQAEDLDQFRYKNVDPKRKLIRLVETEVRRWPLQNESASIVLLGLDVSLGCETGPPGFIIGVLDSAGKLLARSDQITSFGSQMGSSAEHTVTIDTARYRINDDEQAFGVRVQHGNEDLDTCFDDEVLHVFRIVGDKVVRILTTDAGYDQTDVADGVLKPECHQTFQKGTFRMLPTKTLGFYDLERKMTGGVRTVVYHWNETGYAMVGPDPIDHTIRGKWDGCTGLPSCIHTDEGCEKRPGYPWDKAPRPAESQGAAPLRSPDAK